MALTDTQIWDRWSDPAAVARAQGWSNVVGGAWPLIGIRSFEAIFGPKTDRWLVYTVAGLLITNGTCQVLAARHGEEGAARTLGYGTAGTLLAIDVVFVSTGTIRPTYLIDAALEAGWLALWARAKRSR